jgi:hypothetical protein
MSTWKLGTLVVSSGGESNDDLFVSEISAGAAHFEHGPPPGCWTVDPDSDWTIHAWMLEVARGSGMELETDYEPKDSDIPKKIREYVKACESAEDVPGRVY